MYASTIGQYWDPPMAAQDETVDLFTAEVYYTLGALFFAGSCLMMDEYPEPYPAGGGIDMFNTWILFGDPSLTVLAVSGMKVTPGTNFETSGPSGGPFEPDSLMYTLANKDSEPISFEVACEADWLDLTLQSGSIPADGTVDIDVQLNQFALEKPPGIYESTIQFVNTTNHDGDTERTVRLKAGQPEQALMFDLNQDPGWSCDGEWEWGAPAGLGGDSYGNPDPSSGYTGSNVYGVNLQGDYEPIEGEPCYLVTAPLDCSNLFSLTLKFKRRLNTDYQPYASASVQISVDGQNWTLLWDNPESTPVADNEWIEQTFDISAIADMQPSVVIRFGYHILQDAYPYSGWNLDDLEIWGIQTSAPTPTPTPNCINDGDPDNSGDLTPSDALVAFQIYLGINPNPSYEEECSADCDGSEAVTPEDALCIFQNYITGSCQCQD